MQRSSRRVVPHVRQMPKIYGNLQSEPRRIRVGFLLKWAKEAFILGLVGVFVYWLFFGPTFKIHSVEVDGALLSSTDTFRALVPLQSNIWRISSQHIIFMVQQDPIVQSVRVSKGLPHTVRILVQEKKPALLWVTGGTTWLVDNHGQAFLHYDATTMPASGTPQADLLATVPVLQDTNNLPVDAEGMITSPVLITFIANVQSSLPSYLPQLPVDHFELVGATYDVTMVTKPGMRVQMSSVSDAGVQVRNLTRLVTQENIPLTAQVNLLIPRWAYVK